jgi:hypothetical protein
MVAWARICVIVGLLVSAYYRFVPNYLVQGLLWISVMLYEQKEQRDEYNRRTMRNRNGRHGS